MRELRLAPKSGSEAEREDPGAVGGEEVTMYDANEFFGRKKEPKFGEWVSVKERLPEERINPNTRDFEYVLCATIWSDVRPFKYGTPIGSKDAHFWNGAGYVDAYVNHWMPLPAPPKEVEP